MRNTLFAVVVLLFAPPAANAQTSYPMLMSLKPTAAQIGRSSEHTLTSRYTMHGAGKVIVTGTGVTGEIVTPMKKLKPGEARPNLTRIKIRFTVAPDAKPGVRDFRLATPNGASTLGQLVVVRDPVVVESAKNNSPEQAQDVKLPAAICGEIERAEDVDDFRFRAKAGQEFTFHVRSMRLEDRIHDLQKHVDPIIAVRNEAGSTLAESDNRYAADPLLHFRVPQDGEYFLEIRDVRYHGNRYWEYCIEATDRPFLTAVHPLGVKRGGTTMLQLAGYGLSRKPADPRGGKGGPAVEFAAAKSLPAGPQTVQLRLPDGKLSNPVAVVADDLPQTVERDGENNSYKTAQRAVVPGGISGRISEAADIDCFAFAAKKGESFRFEVFARRCNSALDSHLRILDAKTGRQLALNDDLSANRRTSPDSRIDSWTAPADGQYVVEVRDMNLAGGEDFVYYVQATKAEPTFELYLDTDKTQLFPGTSAVIFARAIRKNGFAGGIQLAIDGLPPGVTASCGRILPGKPTDGCIVLTAAPDAKPDAANVTVTGRASVSSGGRTRTIAVEAVPQQETYMPGGGRNHWHVDLHTVCVGQPCDIRGVTLSTYDVSLKPGESKRIDVTIQRSPGYNKNVTLDLLYRHLSSTFADTLPPGVTIDARNSKTLLTGKVSQGHITLKAAPGAKPVAKQQVSVMANISINFVMKATYSARPLFVTVQKP